VSLPIKRLYRSRTDARIAGICAGLGDYLNMDPVVLRLIGLVATIMTGVIPGLVAYLGAWLIVPQVPLPLPAHTVIEQPQ